uniref:Uncharacterized protein n=1 Tax=Cyanistes caeruleus TaxID=156563 RepID=A0A8C0VIQ7_CYACU
MDSVQRRTGIGPILPGERSGFLGKQLRCLESHLERHLRAWVGSPRVPVAAPALSAAPQALPEWTQAWPGAVPGKRFCPARAALGRLPVPPQPSVLGAAPIPSPADWGGRTLLPPPAARTEEPAQEVPGATAVQVPSPEQLERENSLLKTLASPEQLEKFQSRLPAEVLCPEEQSPGVAAPAQRSGGSAV